MRNSIESRIIGIEEEVRPDANVVVIDVVRAFACTALALERGRMADMRVIQCVETLEEARSLKGQWRSAILMGEERGMKPDGFDLGNSPAEIIQAPGELFEHATCAIQRTSNGTRGLLKASRTAGGLWLASAVNVGSTCEDVAEQSTLHRRPIDLMITDVATGEDLVCAQHIQEQLLGGHSTPADKAKLREAVLASSSEHQLLWRRPRTKDEVEAFQADVEACADVDRCMNAVIGFTSHGTENIVTAQIPTDGGDGWTG